jgi:cation:H+ antiporter
MFATCTVKKAIALDFEMGFIYPVCYISHWRYFIMEEFAHVIGSISTIYLFFIIAILVFVLTKGADLAVEGAVGLARAMNISPLVIGATVVSIGTTLPEAFVSVMAAWSGNPGLALGNGVGSIIVDTSLILGSTCLFFKVPIERYILNRTGWIQVFSATLLVIISIIVYFFYDPPLLSRWVGLLFLILLVGYLYLTYLWSKKIGFLKSENGPKTSLVKGSFQVFFGLCMVIISSKLLVISAQEVARRFGVPEDVIAATMVALGTSLPELMTAVTAVKKGHPEIMIGNIVGADVLNCFFVIGASALISPLSIPENFYFLHFPVMLIILYSFRFFISLKN